MTFAVVRLRGKADLEEAVRDTLRMLHLTRQNHCVIVAEGPTSRGMLQVVKDYVTWGEVEADILARLLVRKGRAIGERAIDDGYVRDHSRFKSIEDFSQAVARGDASLRDVAGLRPVLRLHPPVKGLRSIKRAYREGGDLGFRGKAINDLLQRMLVEEVPADAA